MEIREVGIEKECWLLKNGTIMEHPPDCACGCGRKVERNKHYKYKWNKYIKGHYANILNKNNPRGDIHGLRNPNWRGGRRRDADGYILIKDEKHPFKTKKNLVYEHRLIMESYLRRFNPNHQSLININGKLYIDKSYDVHHINGIKDDNRIENLQGILHSEHIRNHLSDLCKGEYTKEFNQKLKEIIRKRDGNACSICGKKALKPKLCVHHIDYNKSNNSESNLISICKDCHIKTNHHKEAWMEYFKKILEA